MAAFPGPVKGAESGSWRRLLRPRLNLTKKGRLADARRHTVTKKGTGTGSQKRWNQGKTGAEKLGPIAA